ncbi:MAG: ParB/RepB/Spo0J family partition protein [Bacillota bacterium]|nr:ParB/RepB/Spo0J family partition protein [Bacillota bacterium]
MGSDMVARLVAQARVLFAELEQLPLAERVEAINAIRLNLHEYSPFKGEPVDCVLWVEAETVQANDYNPNTVAPPEMELLRLSIREDGYTQPIVAFRENGGYTVVDGFHRNRVGKECPDIRQRIHGYLPITIVRPDREDVEERMASTIRHNRARGKHGVEGMSRIVMELSRRNWSDEKIAKKLGMDADEVLRLKQITGLAELFADAEFSEAWEA